MFEWRTVLVTGAASGLGRCWVENFVKDGATVIAADINEEGLADLENTLNYVVDVTDAMQVERMVEFAIEQTGRLDVLFNNAGLGYSTPLEASATGEFENHVAVHLFGAANGMRAAIPHMRRIGYGRIINTLSRAAEVDKPGTSAYAAAKAGVWALSRVAAQEVNDADICVNMLIPGPTNTSIWGRDMPNLQDAAETYPTAKMLASLPAGGPTGKVFWNEKEYSLFATSAKQE